jgi:hypothetical protein
MFGNQKLRLIAQTAFAAGFCAGLIVALVAALFFILSQSGAPSPARGASVPSPAMLAQSGGGR